MLTGQGVANSRGVDDVAGQMGLCTGTGPVVVYTDADGQPTRPPHYCPDYAMSLLGALHPADLPQPEAPAYSRAVPDRVLYSLISPAVPFAAARAPPV